MQKSRHVKSNFKCLNKYKTNSVKSRTALEQAQVEQIVLNIYLEFEDLSLEPKLLLNKHIRYLKNGLIHFNQSYECFDASQSWLAYWIVHSLILLGEDNELNTQEKVLFFLNSCQSNEGGFGGGPYQIPHLAASYAAVNALCSIKFFNAYEVIDRESMQCFLLEMKQQDGSFTLNKHGETDIRGAYCAITIALLLNIFRDDMFINTAKWVASCQTYEGGFGCVPGSEAHGGYTFCGFATLLLLHQESRCNIPNLTRWIVSRQRPLEGGFNGRTNKLVDSCYSFWVGALFPLLAEARYVQEQCENASENNLPSPLKFCNLFSEWLFDSGALQNYILLCCQDPNGSLLDKPGKPKDYYHSCYALSGLSIAQHPIFAKEPYVVGSFRNLLKNVHPIYNLEIEAELHARSYFSKLLIPNPQK